MQTSRKSRVQLWLPGMFDFKGGIQVFSGFFLTALSEILVDSEIDVYILHDKKSNSRRNKKVNTKFHFFGNWPSQIRNFVYSIQIIIASILKPPDLVITTHLNFTPIAKLINQFLGSSYWTVAHGVEAWDIRNPKLEKSLKRADKILAVSSYTRQRLIQEQNLSEEKVSIFPNTVNVEEFQPGEKSEALLSKYKIGIQQPILLSVCRLCASETYKSYEIILKALPEIKETIPDIHYIIVGKGDDMSRLEKLIKDNDLETSVTLTGFVPDTDLCAHYQLCDLFVLPSKLEGFGIVYLEAMACNRPVLGGNQDGAVDALDRGNLGILVDPDDVTSLSKTIIDFLEKIDSVDPASKKPVREKMISLFGPHKFKSRLAQNLSESGIF